MAKKKKQKQTGAAGSPLAADAAPHSADEPPAVPTAGELADAVEAGDAGAAPADDAETRSRRAFFGRSGHLAVMAEFLHRRINVAIPEVDVGDDVLVVKGTDAAVTRVQVKAATAKEQNDSFFALINVPLDQLSVPQDTPSLVYVFPIRHRNRWSDFIVIRRSTLFAIHTDGAGRRFVDDKGNMQVQFRIVFRETSALCGPAAAADFQPFRDAWEPWPPSQLTNAPTPVQGSPAQEPSPIDVPADANAGGFPQPSDGSKPATLPPGPSTP